MNEMQLLEALQGVDDALLLRSERTVCPAVPLLTAACLCAALATVGLFFLKTGQEPDSLGPLPTARVQANQGLTPGAQPMSPQATLNVLPTQATLPTGSAVADTNTPTTDGSRTVPPTATPAADWTGSVSGQTPPMGMAAFFFNRVDASQRLEVCPPAEMPCITGRDLTQSELAPFTPDDLADWMDFSGTAQYIAQDQFYRALLSTPWTYGTIEISIHDVDQTVYSDVVCDLDPETTVYAHSNLVTFTPYEMDLGGQTLLYVDFQRGNAVYHVSACAGEGQLTAARDALTDLCVRYAASLSTPDFGLFNWASGASPAPDGV